MLLDRRNAASGMPMPYAALSALLLAAALALLLPSAAQTVDEADHVWLTDQSGQTGDAGLPHKFDDGFYGKIAGLAQAELAKKEAVGAGGERHYGVLVVVSRQAADGMDADEASRRNKAAVVNELNLIGAQNVRAAESLSFVTASIPVGEIPGFSLHDEVYRMGDGEIRMTPALGTARATIHATPGELRQSVGTVPDGSGVVVGVLDTGINHPGVLNAKVSKRVLCTDSGGCVDSTTESVTGLDPPIGETASHGTVVAQIIAASGLGEHGGIAPGVELLDADIFHHNGPPTTLISDSHALDWLLTNGADVATLSFAYQICSKTRELAIGVVMDEAVIKGLVVVATTGNDGARSESDPSPAYGSVDAPGCGHNVITVGGIDDRDPADTRMYVESGRGPVYNRGSDGTTGPTLKPEIVAPGVDLSLLRFVANNTMATLNGTSLAAPQVSAAAALLLQERNLEPVAVKAALLLGANWTGPVPCTSMQYERSDGSDGCSHARQPSDHDEANNAESLGILNNVGFGILDVSRALKYASGDGGDHVVHGHIGSDADVMRYSFTVPKASEPVKVILTWTTDTRVYEVESSLTALHLEPRVADLGFAVDCPGGDTVRAQSAYQTNEFAVFEPARAGVCTVTVSGSGIDDLYRTGQGYALASTLPLVQAGVAEQKARITTSEISPTNARTIAFTVYFGEPIDRTLFTSDDIVATIDGAPLPRGSVSVTGSIDDRTFAFTVADIPDGNLMVRIPDGAMQHLAPFSTSNAAEPFSIVVDLAAPVPTVRAGEASPTNAQSVGFTADFGEPIDPATFGAEDIEVTNGAASSPLATDGRNRTFAFSVTAPSEGALTVSIPADRVRDLAGNGNAASNPSGIEIDRSRPVPTVRAGEASPTSAQSVEFTADFGEPIDPATFDAEDIEVTNGAASPPLATDGRNRTFAFSVAAPSEGALTVGIPADRVRDLAGNGNAASNPSGIEIDRTGPRIIAAYVIPPDTVYLRYNEAVDAAATDGTGFTLSGGAVGANTDPDHESSIIILAATGASASDGVTYRGDIGTVTDMAANGAGTQSVTLANIADGTVSLPAWNIGRYEVPPHVSAVDVRHDALPAVLVAQGELALNFSGAPGFSSNGAAKTVVLTDSTSEVTARVNGIDVAVTIPAGIRATAGPSWDGSINLPAPPSIDFPARQDGLTIYTPRVVFSVGSDTPIRFDLAVRLLIPGEGGPDTVAFVSDGAGSHEYIDPCTFEDSQEAANGNLANSNLANRGVCYLKEGGDMIIWTKSFSHFGTYAVTVRSQEPEPGAPAGTDTGTVGGNGGGGDSDDGGGGDGGVPEEIATDVRLYSVSWNCNAGIVRVVAGPDTGSLLVRISTSSAGEQPVAEIGSGLPGTRAFISTITWSDTFVVVEGNLGSEGDRVVTKVIQLEQCSGTVVIDMYDRQQAGTDTPAPEPEPRELCRDGREPALRDGSALLCLFPGTFEVLVERGWDLSRPQL